MGAVLLAGCTTVASPSPSLPVRFLLGADAASAGVPGSYLAALEVAPDGSSFSTSVVGVAGGTLLISELLLLENTDDVAHDVTLAANLASPVRPVQEHLDVRDAGGAALGSVEVLPGGLPGTTVTLAPHQVAHIALSLSASEAAAGTLVSQAVRATLR